MNRVDTFITFVASYLFFLVVFVALVLVFANWNDAPDIDGPQIGGHEVPADLVCEEDDVIGFVQVGEPPYRLGCLHIDGGYGWEGN